MNFLNNIQLNGNEIRGFVIQVLGAQPTDPKRGRKYYNSMFERESVYDGSKWKLAAYMDDLDALSQTNTELAGVVAQLRTEFDALNKALNEDDTAGIVNTWNEIVELVNGLPEGSDLATLIASINTAVEVLQEEVENLKNSATKVEWVPVINEGKQIGTLTIDGKGNAVYAPATYAWDDITGKTAEKLVAVLGFTPFNAASFTKANIQQTLGISDWALNENPPTAAEVGATRKVSKLLNNTTDATQDVNHGLNTQWVVVQVFDPTSYEQILVDVVLKDANNVTLKFASAPGKKYLVVIIG